MTCVSPSAETWRERVDSWTNEDTSKELRRAWVEGKQRIREAGRQRVYHDWTSFRAATLREARKRGLDLSVVPARTLGT